MHSVKKQIKRARDEGFRKVVVGKDLFVGWNNFVALMVISIFLIVVTAVGAFAGDHVAKSRYGDRFVQFLMDNGAISIGGWYDS